MKRINRKRKQYSTSSGNRFLTLTLDSNLKFADDDGNAKRFSGVAYTGDKADVFWGGPVVVDLARLRHPIKARPVLFNHNPEMPIGHFDPAELINDGTRLVLSGVLSGSNEATREIIDSARNGFPWQMSIGVSFSQATDIGPGETVEINGRKFTGPLIVTRESELKEISFVSLGADDNTSATVAAKFMKGLTMSFEEYVKSLGLDPDAISEDLRKVLEEEFAKKGADEGDGDGDSDDANAGGAVNAAAGKSALRLASGDRNAERHLRMMEIGSIAADPKYASLSADAKSAIFARARKENIVADHARDLFDLELERANRKTPPDISYGKTALDLGVAKAAMMLHFGVKPDTVEKAFAPATLDFARKEFSRGGIKDIARACLEFEGQPWLRQYNGNRDESWIRAAFSTASFPELLKDSVNKFLVDAYEEQPLISRRLARKLTANDYKIHTGVMFTGGGTWEEVATGGQIKYGEIGKEETFTFQVKDWGEIVSITNVMLVNDDLGAIQDSLRNNIARKGARTEERSFFDMVAGNARGFFSVANDNFITGILNTDSLAAAIQLFRMQKNVYGEPIEMKPSVLLVPPALEQTAIDLCYRREIRPGSTNSKKEVPIENQFYRYGIEVVTTAQIALDRYAIGGVTIDDLQKRWYLLAAPESGAAWGRAYLYGNETPTIEEGPGQFNTLGVEYRGYLPFGHCQIDPRCAVMSDGTNA